MLTGHSHPYKTLVRGSIWNRCSASNLNLDLPGTMPTLELPPYGELKHLFDVVAEEEAELLPGCRWLILGPRLAAIVAPDEAPSAGQLITLLRLLRRQAPELEALGRALVYHSEHGEQADVEACVDKLLEVPNWQHPSQVLPRPRPDFRKLLEASRARSEGSDTDLADFDAMIERLEVAVQVAESARVRRERMRARENGVQKKRRAN